LLVAICLFAVVPAAVELPRDTVTRDEIALAAFDLADWSADEVSGEASVTQSAGDEPGPAAILAAAVARPAALPPGPAPAADRYPHPLPSHPPCAAPPTGPPFA
jgi:hypothetical protein